MYVTMSILTWTTALFFTCLWKHVEMNGKQCQVAKNVLIERLNGASGVVNQVTIDYGVFTTCVMVANNAVIGSQTAGSSKIEKPPPRPLYELVPGMGYYKMHNEPKTWDQAIEICEREGAHLGISNNRREALLFTELRNRLPGLVNDWRKDYGHIGVQKKSGKWVTIFDEPLSKFSSKQPKEERGGDCAMLNILDGSLHSIECNTAAPFFCEREL